MTINRRELLTYSASALGAAAIGLPHFASAEGNELTIAYNVNLPSWDPTTGPSAVNPTIQGLYQSVFDQFIHRSRTCPSCRVCSPNGVGATITSRS